MSQMTNVMNELNTATNTTTREKIEQIIKQHAIGSAATGLAAGVLPGLGSVIATVTSAGVIWTMYYRICREMGLNISKTLLKTLSSALLTNIVTQLGGTLAIEVAMSFVPGMGLIVGPAACYAVTYVAGYMFLKLLVNVFKAGKNPNEMTEAELKAAGKAASSEINCKEIFKAAQEDGKQRIRNGEITKANTIDVEE